MNEGTTCTCELCKLGTTYIKYRFNKYRFNKYRFKMSSTRNRKTWTATDREKLRRMYRSPYNMHLLCLKQTVHDHLDDLL